MASVYSCSDMPESYERFKRIHWEIITLDNAEIIDSGMEYCVADVVEIDCCSFLKASWKDSALYNGIIKNTHFQDSDLDTHFLLQNISFIGTSFSKCRFYKTNFEKCTFSKQGQQVIFTDCIFEGTLFDCCKFHNVKFENCTFSDTKFNDCLFTGVFSFKRPQLNKQSNFIHCVFSRTKIEKCTISLRKDWMGYDHTKKHSRISIDFTDCDSTGLFIKDCITDGLNIECLPPSNIVGEFSTTSNTKPNTKNIQDKDNSPHEDNELLDTLLGSEHTSTSNQRQQPSYPLSTTQRNLNNIPQTHKKRAYRYMTSEI